MTAPLSAWAAGYAAGQDRGRVGAGLVTALFDQDREPPDLEADRADRAVPADTYLSHDPRIDLALATPLDICRAIYEDEAAYQAAMPTPPEEFEVRPVDVARAWVRGLILTAAGILVLAATITGTLLILDWLIAATPWGPR